MEASADIVPARIGRGKAGGPHLPVNPDSYDLGAGARHTIGRWARRILRAASRFTADGHVTTFTVEGNGSLRRVRARRGPVDGLHVERSAPAGI